MACDVLGPRGDEKNGCQADWQAYCASAEKRSQLTSFKANRFNNLFAAAAQLVHHKDDILNFFQLREPTNLKQLSVQADADCMKLNVMLLGLALMYVYIAGPFWIFVRSDIHYLDQRTFIQPMHAVLQEMRQHPDMLLQECDIPEELQTVRLRNQVVVDSVLHARDNLMEDDKVLLQQVMKALAANFLIVTERQLVDFLPDGKYGQEPTPEKREEMAHCQLTNLVGEACFADLDFTMFKNRRAKLHHHSTLNMVKRNKTVSNWLQGKSVKEQAFLMDKARKLGPEMRRQSQQKESIVLEQLQQAMESKRRQNIAAQQRKEEKQRKQKESIMALVTKQGGPCNSSQDVLRILKNSGNKGLKTKNIKAQIDFEKTVMGSNSQLLKTSKVSLLDMCKNYIRFKFNEEPSDALEQACTQPAKRKRPANDTSSDDDMNVSMDTAEDSESRDSESEADQNAAQEYSVQDFNFEFQQQGETVAVYYENDFYIGQVINILNPDQADINFLSSKGNTNEFRWPRSEDIDCVEAKFVFYSGFELLPKNRTWHIDTEGWNSLQARWKAYQQLFSNTSC